MSARPRRGFPARLAAVAGMVSMASMVGYARLASLLRESRLALEAALAREAELRSRVKELSFVSFEAFQEHDDGGVMKEEEKPPEDPFDCYFEDCGKDIVAPDRQKESPAKEKKQQPRPEDLKKSARVEAVVADRKKDDKPLWMWTVDMLAVGGGDVVSEASTAAEDSVVYKRSPVSSERCANKSLEATTSVAARGRPSQLCASNTESAVLDDVQAALTEELLSSARLVSQELGDTRREQWIRVRKKSKRDDYVAFTVVGYELACSYPRLTEIRAAWASARQAGYWVFFVAADAAAMAALTAAKYPAVAASDDINERAWRSLRAAAVEARLRQGRRLLSSIVEEAAVLDAFLEQSSLGSLSASSPRQEEDETLRDERSEAERTRAALRFDAAAELSARGMRSVFFEARTAWFAPRRGKRQARLALRDVKPDKAVRMATRQASSRVPCPSFFVSQAWNASAVLLKKLARLSRRTNSRVELSRAIASTLRLGGNAPSALSALTVACAPRPRFVVGRRDDLAAIVFQGPPSARRSTLAAELGLTTTMSSEEDDLLIARDAAIDLYEPFRSLRYLRLAVAHLAAAALLSRKTLVLPAVHHDERTFFLWTYLDLASLDDLGLKWRHTHYLHNRPLEKEGPVSIAIDDAFATVDDDAKNHHVFFEMPKQLPPEQLLWTLILDHVPERSGPLVLHLPFLANVVRADNGHRLLRPDRAQRNPALLVADKLRWCDKGFRPGNEAHFATAAADCYGRGVRLDAFLSLATTTTTTTTTPGAG